MTDSGNSLKVLVRRWLDDALAAREELRRDGIVMRFEPQCFPASRTWNPCGSAPSTDAVDPHGDHSSLRRDRDPKHIFGLVSILGLQLT